VHGFVDFEYREGVAPRKMERRRRKQEWAALLRDAVGTRYDAVVTGVTPKATWIRTIQPEVEGRLVRGTRGLAIGDRVRVVLLATDASRGWIDFARERIGAGAAEEGAP
jgi:exoribonuclease-2